MLKIGDFARLGRVSVKALRHYDEMGLLRPAHVDRVGGYRYYAPQQLTTLGEILLLKDFGFPLKEIVSMLQGGSSVLELVETRHRDLQRSVAEDLGRLRRLGAFRDALAISHKAAAVRLSAIEPVLALTERRYTRSGDGQITEIFESLERQVAKSRGRASSSPFLMFHDSSNDDTLDVEVCIPLKAEAGGLRGARIVEGCEIAGSITYRGSYAETPVLFATLAAWVDSHGGILGGPLREVYHCFSADQRGYKLPARMLSNDTDGFVTEVQVPLKSDAAHA